MVAKATKFAIMHLRLVGSALFMCLGKSIICGQENDPVDRRPSVSDVCK
jgi:hypothetical protein